MMEFSTDLVKPVPNNGCPDDHTATLPTPPVTSVPPQSLEGDLEAAHPCAQGDKTQEGPANGLASSLKSVVSRFAR